MSIKESASIRSINGVKFVNLTPHEVTLTLPSGEEITFPPSGVVARLKAIPGEDLPPLAGVVPARVAPAFGGVANLPEPNPETIYIVSGITALAVRREDVFYPDTGPDAVRDEKGNIVAVRRLIRSV